VTASYGAGTVRPGVGSVPPEPPSEPRVVEVDPSRPRRSRGGIDWAVEALLHGELVVLPTETVYGIAARPDDAGATARLFAAKRRPRGLSLPILVPDAGSAWTLGRRTSQAEALADAYWPGPLTLVLERTALSSGWALGDEARTIGLRVPDLPLALALLRRAGPIAATSANLSGRPPLGRTEDLLEAFGNLVAVYLVLRREAPEPGGVPSTVVDVTRSPSRFVREGAIGVEPIRRILSGGGGEATL
jgi:L-threonylcarbamoyladenylate synthase